MHRKTKSSGIAFRKHDHRRCQRQLLSAVSELCSVRKLRLTPRRRQVLEIMLASHQPMGAYDILAELNRAGKADRIAPPIVYRALEFLMAEGLIHRIESRNAFITCVHPGHESAAQFLAAADNLGFAVDHSVVEITGVCARCQKHAG